MTQHDKAKGQPYDRRAVSLKSKHQCVRVAADAPTRLLLPDFRAGFTGNYTQLDSRPSQNSTVSETTPTYIRVTNTFGSHGTGIQKCPEAAPSVSRGPRQSAAGPGPCT